MNQNTKVPPARLAAWERDLLTADATFLRTDGREVVVENVNPDTIGPSGANPGVVAVEYADGTDRVVHLPFIERWTVEYR